MTWKLPIRAGTRSRRLNSRFAAVLAVVMLASPGAIPAEAPPQKGRAEQFRVSSRLIYVTGTHDEFHMTQQSGSVGSMGASHPGPSPGELSPGTRKEPG